MCADLYVSLVVILLLCQMTQQCHALSTRHLEHSTIIYEDPQRSPLLRLSWNKQDPNYLATFSLDAMEVCFAHIWNWGNFIFSCVFVVVQYAIFLCTKCIYHMFIVCLVFFVSVLFFFISFLLSVLTFFLLSCCLLFFFPPCLPCFASLPPSFIPSFLPSSLAPSLPRFLHYWNSFDVGLLK